MSREHEFSALFSIDYALFVVYSSRRLYQYPIFSLLAGQLVYLIYRNISYEQSYPKLTGVYCATGKLDDDSLDRHPIDDSLNIRQCSLTNIDACQRISSQTLLFQMRNTAGFASEINNLLRVFLYAIQTRRKFLIDDQNWNYGPFNSLFNTSQGHFSPWLPSSPDCHRRTFVHFIHHLRDNGSIPAHLFLGRDSDGGFTTLNTMVKAYESNPRILQRKRRVARYLWNTMNYQTRSFLQKSLDEIQIQAIHYAVHIRRGDKLREEAKYIDIERYLESVEYLMRQQGESGELMICKTRHCLALQCHCRSSPTSVRRQR